MLNWIIIAVAITLFVIYIAKEELGISEGSLFKGGMQIMHRFRFLMAIVIFIISCWMLKNAGGVAPNVAQAWNGADYYKQPHQKSYKELQQEALDKAYVDNLNSQSELRRATAKAISNGTYGSGSTAAQNNNQAAAGTNGNGNNAQQIQQVLPKATTSLPPPEWEQNHPAVAYQPGQ